MVSDFRMHFHSISKSLKKLQDTLEETRKTKFSLWCELTKPASSC